jgi:hypothetical protein
MHTRPSGFVHTNQDSVGIRAGSRLHRVVLFALFGALLTAFTPALHAQFRASIQGTVTDTSGAVIPGATLTLTDTQTNQKRVQTSDASGVYTFNALPPDIFTLVVDAKGFEQKAIADLHIIPEQPNSVDVQLTVGSVAQTVTVNGSTQPALDTETANDGATISSDQIQHTPLYERDVTSLMQLAPGVLDDGAQQPGGGGFFSPGTQTQASSGGGGNLGHSSSIFATENGAAANANGGQFQTNGYSIDGISTDSAVWGGATIITPSEDSIANVRVLTNDYDAEYGRYSGAIMQITSKSGTNQLHGSLFAQIVRPGLNAYQRWNGPQTVQAFDPVTGKKLTPQQRGLLRDVDRYNQFGGSIGGPFWKNRLFGFFAYEGQSQNVAQTSDQWFPTSQFAGLAPGNSIAHTYLTFPQAAVSGTVIGSATCHEAGLTEGVNCVTIPGQGLNIGSPLTTGLGTQDLTYVSSANPGVGSGLSNVPDIAQYSISDPTKSDFKQYNGRLDADITNKDHATFAIYWVPASITHLNGGLGYQLFNHDQVNDAFSGIWNHIFSPTFLNEARANAAGWRYNELASNPQAPFGLPQDSVLQIGSINIGNLGVSAPGVYDQWTYDYRDVATKVLRTHNIKFGFDLTRLYYLNDPIGAPNYTFYNIWDFLNDAPEAEGGPFQATTGRPGGYRNDNRENLWAGFVQDYWKMRSNLTISAGLRYSYFGPITDKDNNMGVLLFGSGSSYLASINIRHTGGEWNAQKANFSPDLGFNWSPGIFHNKMVLRGGYGISYNGFQIANANNDDNNPPGTNYISSSSTSPAHINPDVVYAVSSSPTNINGYPANPHAITTFNSAGLPTAGGANLSGVQNDLPTEYEHHYSLEVDQQLGPGWVWNLGYMGSVGRNLTWDYDANGYGVVVKGAGLNPLVNSVNTFGGLGKSHNNMMLAGLKHQFSHGFSLDAQYTWAHSFDMNSGPYSRSPYIFNPSYSYGTSDFDIRNNFKLYGVWQPVLFHGGHAFLEKVAGGWALSGIMTLHSGYGWTPYYTAPHQIYCNVCNYGYPSLRPNYLGGGGTDTSNKAFENGSNFTNPGTADTGTNNNMFKDNYFQVPDYSSAIADNPGQVAGLSLPAPGIGRNNLHGPSYRDVDLNLAKSFGLPETRLLGDAAQITIKANMFNAFNLLNINPSSLSTNIQSSNLGQAGSALGSRMVDFQARFSF